MKTSMLLTALLAALLLAGCSTYRGGTADDDYRYSTGHSSDGPNHTAISPVRDFTQPMPPP